MYINNKKVRNIFYGTQAVAKIVADNKILFSNSITPEPVGNPYILCKTVPCSGEQTILGVCKITGNDVNIYVDGSLIPFAQTYNFTDEKEHEVKIEFVNGVPTSFEQLFNNCNEYKEIDFTNCDTSSVTYMLYMFSGCSSLKTIPLLDTSNVTYIGSMFYNCSSLTSIPLLDTSSVTNMNGMFWGCSSLTTIPLLDTSSVTNMRYMFGDCSSLTTIPLLDTSSVTNMGYMFSGCSALTSIPHLNTHSVTDMHSMFNGCYTLKTIPLLDTHSVTDMGYMFGACYVLTSVELKGGVKQGCNCSNMFNAVYTTGVFYHDANDYLKIIDILPPNWTHEQIA